MGMPDQAPFKMRGKVKTFDYSRDNTLLVPASLSDMQDIDNVATHGSRPLSVFYKKIDNDLTDLEFHTGETCLVYLLSGRETVTDFDDHALDLHPGELLFLQRDLFLYSDFIRQGGPLQALLFFYDHAIIDRFLASQSPTPKKEPVTTDHFFKLPVSEAVDAYMTSLRSIFSQSGLPPSFLENKLLELLYLVAAADRDGQMVAGLSATHEHQGKRNILRIMENHCFRNLTVGDYAAMTGRSLSSFNREFRRLTRTSPKQWLINRRLEKARELLNDSNLSVTDVALEVGYESPSHFIKMFREKYKVTPKQHQTPDF